MAEDEPAFFESAAALREWFELNHAGAAILHVGYYNKGSKRPSVTYPESLDEALCFGWIDGVRRNLDTQSYSVRFTPRRAGSIWSAANVERMNKLIAAGLAHASGLAAFESRDPDKTNMYSFEQRQAAFDEAQEARFKANEAAWLFFQAQPPGYRRVVTWWVISARQEATRQRRLEVLIADCTAGRRRDFMSPRRANDAQGES